MSLTARPLTAAAATVFARLCAREPVRLLTPRLNIEYYGFEGPTVRAWGVFTAQEREMRGLMLRFGNTAVVVDGEGECAPTFATLIDREGGLAGVRGTMEVVRNIEPLLSRYETRGDESSFLMRLTHPPVCAPETLALARRARPGDLDRLSVLYSGAGTMYRSRASVASKLAETRVFVVEVPEPARIVSCALLNVEGHDAGLIGGVYTLPAARGRGYASACVAALSLDLQREGKLPCLFYENPVAGRIYEHLGFEEIGQWTVLYLSPVRERP